ncbi:MAG TPA: ATP-binding protein, partial [Polyangiaceae bacterium]|nr:ATP-binding protein [Polyangiaceae bacterium]
QAAQNAQTAELIRVITAGVTAKTGADFYRELVRSLSATLQAHTVFVAQIDAAKYEADMLALWSGGQLHPPQRFDLSGTPCESILDGHIASFPRRVAELFPAARELIEKAGIKSYLAIPILDEPEQVIGHIAVQDQRERDWSETDFDILRLFANRAAAELKRGAHERMLENTNSQLQKANAALRREVAKRLEMEEQLARAKQMAEEARQVAEAANNAKSNFLAHMSHELRTPLNGILGYTQLLKRDPTLSSAQLENLAVVERSGEHLLMLINDLLDLAKIEAGRLDISTSLFDLALLVKHAADIASVRANQCGIAFRVGIAPDVPREVRGDERATRQVLFNLLGNAVKFTRQGSVELRVAVVKRAEDACRIRFEIQDTGGGIAADDLQRVFEPFDRGRADAHVEGTGLGLPITQRLVNAMGGTLHVTSVPGQGSTFIVELDLDVATRPDRAQDAAGIEHQGMNGLEVDSELATELYDLAMKGDVTELLSRADLAAQRDVRGAPLYDEVRRLARQYDMKGVRRVLQRVHGRSE